MKKMGSEPAISVFHHQFGPRIVCFPFRYSEKFEILRMKRGMARVVIGAESINASMGDLVFVPPKKIYSVSSGPSPVEFDLIKISVSSFVNETDILREFLPALSEGRVKLNKLCFDISLRASVDSIANARDLGSIEVISAVYRFFYLLLSKCGAEIIDSHRSFISKAEKFIYENAFRDLKALAVAMKFGYNEAYFCRIFKKETGMSFLSYLKVIRLSAATEFLEQGLSIKQVAKKCGYSDQNYFTRLFKAHFGVPPSHFKRKKTSHSLF